MVFMEILFGAVLTKIITEVVSLVIDVTSLAGALGNKAAKAGGAEAASSVKMYLGGDGDGAWPSSRRVYANRLVDPGDGENAWWPDDAQRCPRTPYNRCSLNSGSSLGASPQSTARPFAPQPNAELSAHAVE